MKKAIDLIGYKFGHLTVVSRSENFGKIVRWECFCSCGGKTITSSANLRNGHTKSCGCLRKNGNGGKHGMSNSPEYKIWSGMKRRCRHNEKYYTERGISVFSGWLNDFMEFFNHIGPRPTAKHQIDRIENSEGYFPGNVRWATRQVNARNRRRAYIWSINGKTYQTAKEAALENGVNHQTINRWAKNGTNGCSRVPRYNS